MDCFCFIHIREEAKEPEKKWLECLGHGENCPCTKKGIDKEKEKV
jgi:hypothetical protein